MEQSEYIAALDLGTSKMLAMAVSKNREGVLTILGSEKMPSGNCIRRGYIHHVEETAGKVSSLVGRLSNRLQPKLKKIYVGIGGQSLRTESYTVRKEINGATINQKLIDSIKEECFSYEPELAEVLDIVSSEFYLDGLLEPNPIDCECNVIEAKCQLILGRPSLKSCLIKSIEERAEIEIAGFFIAPLATATVALSEKEKELGCALIELGAGITYLSIYKGGLLRYLVAIPLGGNVITKDISAELNQLEQDAEDLKIKKGSALVETEPEEKVDLIIEARCHEIIANIIEQIRLSGYETALAEGIVITGGGALLKNLLKAIRLQMGREDVRMAGIDEQANACTLGLLTLGTENCAKEVEKRVKENTDDVMGLFGDEIPVVLPPKPEEKQKKEPKPPKTPKEGFFTRITRTLFDDDTSNAQE
jgi:cell division protein FtsA